MSNKKRAQLKNKGERERLRLKKQHQENKIDEILEEKELRQEDVPEVDEIEKDYGEDMPMIAMGSGPTSFDELDEMEAAQEKLEEVNKTSWQVQDLVRNILFDPELEPTEKADRIMDVADEYAARVNSVTMADEDMKKDMDVLQIEAILASYDRHTSLLEKGRDWAEDLIKRKLSYGARKRLDDSDFALPSKRKYPIHDKAHVRNALARAAQQIKRGGEAASDAKSALPKIRAAAKRMGIEVGVEKSAILVEKDQAGDWRWIGKPSNNFIDWQGDIMSKSAHQKYVTWLDANMDLAPAYLHWHTPGTARTYPVDFAMEHEGALIMSGKLTEPEAAALLKMQAQVDLGMSVQGLGLRLDPTDPRVITDYWLYEVSDLPLDKAANPFTSLETIAKEAGMDKLQYLTEMMGSAEKAKAFLEKTGQMQKQLQEAGLTSKEQAPVEEPKAETQPPATPTAAEIDVKSLTAQIVKAVGVELDIEGLNSFVAEAKEALEKVQLLEGVVKELRTSKDEELVKALTPPVARFAWSSKARPSASPDNKLTKDKADEDLQAAAPGVKPEYWLSEVTHTVPVQ